MLHQRRSRPQRAALVIGLSGFAVIANAQQPTAARFAEAQSKALSSAVDHQMVNQLVRHHGKRLTVCVAVYREGREADPDSSLVRAVPEQFHPVPISQCPRTYTTMTRRDTLDPNQTPPPGYVDPFRYTVEAPVVTERGTILVRIRIAQGTAAYHVICDRFSCVKLGPDEVSRSRMVCNERYDDARQELADRLACASSTEEWMAHSSFSDSAPSLSNPIRGYAQSSEKPCVWQSWCQRYSR